MFAISSNEYLLTFIFNCFQCYIIYSTDNTISGDKTSEDDKSPAQPLLNINSNEPNSLSSSTAPSLLLTTESTEIIIAPNTSEVNETNVNSNETYALNTEIESETDENLTSSDLSAIDETKTENSLGTETDILPLKTRTDESSPISRIQSTTNSILDASTLRETDAMSTEMSTLPRQSLEISHSQNKSMKKNQPSTTPTPGCYTTEIKPSSFTETIQTTTETTAMNGGILSNNVTDTQFTLTQPNLTELSPFTSSTEETTLNLSTLPNQKDIFSSTSFITSTIDTEISSAIETSTISSSSASMLSELIPSTLRDIETDSDSLSTVDQTHSDVKPLQSESLTKKDVNRTTASSDLSTKKTTLNPNLIEPSADLIDISTTIPSLARDSISMPVTSEAHLSTTKHENVTSISRTVDKTTAQIAKASQIDDVPPELKDPVVSRLLKNITSKSHDSPSRGPSDDLSKATSNILSENLDITSTTMTSLDQSTKSASNSEMTENQTNLAVNEIRTNASATTESIESEVTTVNDSSNSLFATMNTDTETALITKTTTTNTTSSTTLPSTVIPISTTAVSNTTDSSQFKNAANGIHNEYMDVDFPNMPRDGVPSVKVYIKRNVEMNVMYTGAACCKSFV